MDKCKCKIFANNVREPVKNYLADFERNTQKIKIADFTMSIWIGTGSVRDDQNQQKPRSSYLVVTHQIDNLPNSQQAEECKSECLRSTYLFTIQYNHGVIIVIIKCDQSMIKRLVTHLHLTA